MFKLYIGILTKTSIYFLGIIKLFCKNIVKLCYAKFKLGSFGQSVNFRVKTPIAIYYKL